MTPLFTDDFVTIYHGDCLAVMADMPAGSVDAIVTDPPYGLSFMGRGTTLKAARAEGHKSIGIDMERDHCEIAWGRMSQGVLI